MAPRLNFFEWWGRETVVTQPKGTPVVVKMEANPSFSIVEIDGPDAAFKPVQKNRLKNAKQVRWILLLKANRAAGSLARLGAVLFSLLATIKNRLILRRGVAVASEKLGKGKLMLAIIKLLLITSVATLVFEVFAHLKGLLLLYDVVPQTSEVRGLFQLVYVVWVGFSGAVYELSISAVCQLDWPKERLLIQILDDSNDESIQWLIQSEVAKWSKKGINIIYRHRLIRTGYKAGNLKSAMSCDYVKKYEFVAIFDADFQPTPDFLKHTVPHFKGNPELGLVQARWAFVNKDENLLTRLQNINLCFHFEVEQQVNGTFLNFFGFNGTAGVWRIKALEDSGGWLERTTVEDMDIAVRAHLNGWKFIYLNDVKVLCEVPESFEAYRKQQHRWHSGPMQLFRLCLPDVINSKISIWKKVNLIFLFFLLRKLILPFYSFTLFCIVLPLTMFIPEIELPMWVICYIPVIMTFLSVLPSPKSIPFIAPYLLFENTMSVTKFNAMISGLFQLGSSYEWIVTKKAGRSSESDSDSADRENDLSDPGSKEQDKGETVIIKKSNKIYRKELALAFLLLTASVRSLLSAHGLHFYFLLFQGLTFVLVGLDLIGEQIS
ncbi:hypothetical protein MIMGU_mgv1a003162mg [Erythranthe guttata]|uniref:Glycosyltransferase 2-like domain-containing protein n=1 Tax=Erythranthe guttata TaxID=4155 RepID=A0A022Q6C1_ERYGU|nr:hypothetical protein MIMGU_mgv1a003162mg [Erythranthe guttata]